METPSKDKLKPMTEFEREMLVLEKKKLELQMKKEALLVALMVAAENSKRAHYRRSNRSWWDW